MCFSLLKSEEEQPLQDSAQATASVHTQESASKLGMCITRMWSFHEYCYLCSTCAALGVLCCFALFVCLTLLASFFLPSHLSFKNMYILASSFMVCFFSADDEPTILELLNFDTNRGDSIDIIDEVGAKYQKFGILLLEDKTCAHVQGLIKKHSGDCESINLEIVQEWLQGRGAKPVSWRTLTKMLKAVKLTVLAQYITETHSEA